MAHYIDKDAVLAEIKRHISIAESQLALFGNEDEKNRIMWAQQKKVCEIILSFIDTLEVKEVDLEKEIECSLPKPAWGWNEDCFGKSDPAYSMEQMKELAKHFFELGLKAQHDNWKVVGNTNFPQADKNKIYCVLSKNKYLLARVREHPQDGYLLQWKCTEFPFHCYDMCEGDKYMQIV